MSAKTGKSRVAVKDLGAIASFYCSSRWWYTSCLLQFTLVIHKLLMCRLGQVWRSADGRGTNCSRADPLAVCRCICRHCRRHVRCRRVFDDCDDGRNWWIWQLGGLWRRCHEQCQHHHRSVVYRQWARLGWLCQFRHGAVSVLFHQVPLDFILFIFFALECSLALDLRLNFFLMDALDHTLTPFCSAVCRRFFGFIPGSVHVPQISSDDVHPVFPWLSLAFSCSPSVPTA